MKRRDFLAYGASASLLPLAVYGDNPAFAPPFELSVHGGGSVALSDFLGEVVLVDFWATWCGPCRVQIPVLNAFAEAHPKVVVLGVSVDTDPTEVVPEFMLQTSISYPVLYGSEELAKQFGVIGFPSLAVVAASGKLVNVHTGLVSKAETLSRLVTLARQRVSPVPATTPAEHTVLGFSVPHIDESIELMAE